MYIYQPIKASSLKTEILMQTEEISRVNRELRGANHESHQQGWYETRCVVQSETKIPETDMTRSVVESQRGVPGDWCDSVRTVSQRRVSPGWPMWLGLWWSLRKESRMTDVTRSVGESQWQESWVTDVTQSLVEF